MNMGGLIMKQINSIDKNIYEEEICILIKIYEFWKFIIINNYNKDQTIRYIFGLYSCEIKRNLFLNFINHFFNINEDGYNKFTTLNFICSPKHECEVEIKAGDPILQVIPFITNKDM